MPNVDGAISLPDLVHRIKRGKPEFRGRVLAVDPGETTGWATFDDLELTDCGQFPVEETRMFDDFITSRAPDRLVIENYRVYASKAAQHVGSEVKTVQYVGVLKFLAEMYQVPVALQMAFQAKGFVTDQRLRQLGIFQVHHRHANDAIRHGVYWLLFGKGV